MGLSRSMATSPHPAAAPSAESVRIAAADGFPGVETERDVVRGHNPALLSTAQMTFDWDAEVVTATARVFDRCRPTLPV